MQLTKNSVISLILVASLLLISLLFYFLLPKNSDSYILYFPHSVTDQIHGELRFAPRRNSFEDKIKLVVEESLLGTKDIQLSNLVPQGKYLEQVFLREGNEVIINFYSNIQEIIIDDENALDRVFSYLELSLRRNFTNLGEIKYLIAGQELWQTPFNPNLEAQSE